MYKVVHISIKLQKSLPRLMEESLSQNTPLKKSHVCKKGSVPINSFAKLLDWDSLLEVWLRWDCGDGSRKAIA